MALFADGCAAAYADVFSDVSATDWCLLGYNAGRKLEVVGTGSSGLGGLVEGLEDADAKVLYALLRITKTDDGGDSKRTKFVFLTWVGESAPAMKRGQVTSHKPQVGELFKGHHVEKQLHERSELDTLQEDIDAMLKKAGGANYDLGNTRSGVQAGSGQATSYKASSKAFFEQKDKETEVKGIVFEKHIRKGKDVMACDLGGRTMTAGAATAQKNTVGYDAGAPKPPAAVASPKPSPPQPAPEPELKPTTPPPEAAPEREPELAADEAVPEAADDELDAALAEGGENGVDIPLP